MQKIDRLGWAAGISIYAYGLRVGIRVSTPDVLDQVTKRLPYEWEPACSPVVDHLYSLKVGGEGARPGARNFHLLYGGLTKLARTLDLEEALDILERDLHMHLAERARNRIFIHAGVVGWQGRAIVIPGRSFSGKSTLVAALLQAGATYYSDEFAVLDGRGHVHPFPRRLSLRQQQAALPPRRCSAEDLGSQPGVAPVPVSLVALARFQAGSRWQPRSLSSGQAALEVMQSTVPTLFEPENAAMTVLHRRPRHDAYKSRASRGEALWETVEKLMQQAAAWKKRYP